MSLKMSLKTFIIVLLIELSRSDNDLADIFKKREDWKATEAKKMEPLEHPVPLVIISHTATPFCEGFQQCSRQIRAMQVYHMKFGDIGYNFLICGDGNIYEGRGWDFQNFHRGHHNDSIGISFIGNFLTDHLNADMINAVKLLLNEGIRLGKLSADYKILAHNQIIQTQSPGPNVFNVISAWSHFDNEIDIK